MKLDLDASEDAQDWMLNQMEERRAYEFDPGYRSSFGATFDPFGMEGDENE